MAIAASRLARVLAALAAGLALAVPAPASARAHGRGVPPRVHASREGSARAAGLSGAGALALRPYMGWDTYFAFGGAYSEATVLRQASEMISLGLRGKPEPASANVLSEHEIVELDKMTPQAQAELLLERSINHYRGANDQIVERVSGWRGKIQLENQQLNSLFMIALNSDDLRVRAAAIEIDIAARKVEKSIATIDALENNARYGEQGPRANALWDIALLGNRGVAPERAFEIVSASIHESNENIRYWAVEGLAYLGTDETVAPLLGVFHDDPSANIRERAACGLAQSGMLSEKQRRTATPSMFMRISLTY